MEIQSTDSISTVTGNGIFQIPREQGVTGMVDRFMVEQPGTYYYTSGYLNEVQSVFASGEITVMDPVDYESEVVVRIDGYRAEFESAKTNPKSDKPKACAELLGDVTGKDIAGVDAAGCTECLRHTYRYQRTPEMESVSFDGKDLILGSNELTGCRSLYTVEWWSPNGRALFSVTSVSGGVLKATLEDPTDDWPIGETLRLRVTQANRGRFQINSNLLRRHSFLPKVSTVTPQIGYSDGGAILTITGRGLYYSHWDTISINVCDNIILYSPNTIKCRTRSIKTGFRNVKVTYSRDTGEEFTFNTNIEYETRDLTPVVRNKQYNNNDLHLDIDLSIPTVPDNLSVSATQFGISIPTNQITSSASQCNTGACYTVSIILTDTTPDYYEISVRMDNFGIIKCGEFARGVSILSGQYNDGSMYGGQQIRLSTTDNSGIVPRHHRVAFLRWGHDLCQAEENDDKKYMCKIEVTSNFEYVITTPSITPSLSSGDSVNTDITFLSDSSTPVITWSGGGAYTWRNSRTPIVTALSSRDLLSSDILSITIDQEFKSHEFLPVSWERLFSWWKWSENGVFCSKNKGMGQPCWVTERKTSERFLNSWYRLVG